MERAFGLLHRRIYERERWSAPSGCCTVVYMKDRKFLACLHQRGPWLHGYCGHALLHPRGVCVAVAAA